MHSPPEVWLLFKQRKHRLQAITSTRTCMPLQWRHNDLAGVSNPRRLHCLFNCCFRRRSKETSELRVTGLCEAIHRWPVNSPHKVPVTRKCFHLMTSSCQSSTDTDQLQFQNHSFQKDGYFFADQPISMPHNAEWRLIQMALFCEFPFTGYWRKLAQAASSGLQHG